MQATADRDCHEVITVRREDDGELAEAFCVAAFGEADEEFSAQAKNVAPFERSGQGDMGQFAEWRNRLGQRRRLRPARLRAQRENDRQLIEHHGGILDKHGIREFRLRRKRDDPGAQL